MAVNAIDAVPPQFVPMRVRFGPSAVNVSWCFDDGLPFDEPFFDQSILRGLRKPFNRAFRPQTSIEGLIEFSRSNACRPPDAFIFHMSRCGSTLLAQMFAALPDTRVISEASTIERILYANRAVPGLSPHTHVDWVRAIVLAYGAGGTARYARYVVKFDAWHIERLRLIEQAFPEVPWIFLFRHPLEVLVSNLAQRAASTLPGTTMHSVPGIDAYTASRLPSEQYLALILAHHMRCALHHQSNPHGLYIDYADLPERALPAIMAHLRWSLTGADMEKMLARSRCDAKQPAARFAADGSRKRDSASPEERELCQTLLLPPYQELLGLCRKS